MPKCLRCGAGGEWIQGDVLREPKSETVAPVLLKALRGIVSILGKPCKDNRCAGCRFEMEAALKAAKKAIGEARGR